MFLHYQPQELRNIKINELCIEIQKAPRADHCSVKRQSRCIGIDKSTIAHSGVFTMVSRLNRSREWHNKVRWRRRGRFRGVLQKLFNQKSSFDVWMVPIVSYTGRILFGLKLPGSAYMYTSLYTIYDVTSLSVSPKTKHIYITAMLLICHICCLHRTLQLVMSAMKKIGHGRTSAYRINDFERSMALRKKNSSWGCYFFRTAYYDGKY